MQQIFRLYKNTGGNAEKQGTEGFDVSYDYSFVWNGEAINRFFSVGSIASTPEYAVLIPSDTSIGIEELPTKDTMFYTYRQSWRAFFFRSRTSTVVPKGFRDKFSDYLLQQTVKQVESSQEYQPSASISHREKDKGLTFYPHVKPIWEIAEALTQDLPEELRQIPTDASVQHDHYIYGRPKK